MENALAFFDLAEALAVNNTLQSIDLSSHPTVNIPALANALQNNRTIEEINLRSISSGFNKEEAQLFANMLAVNKFITSLDLSNNSIDQEFIPMAESLILNHTLTILNLSDSLYYIGYGKDDPKFGSCLAAFY